jgi:alkyl sulfatase BDS1-like metallo-beta-lactamase superfamily hydrolase
VSRRRHGRSIRAALCLAGAMTLAGCGEPREPASAEPDADVGAAGQTAPSRFTREANAAFAEGLPLADARDFADAEHGLVDREDRVVVRTADGRVIWDTDTYAFEQGEAPASVNPSLWRQAMLNNHHGLYRVSERIHQVRGYDLANMSIIEGETGWIIVDPLTATENAEAALAIARKNLGDAPIVAVILTHSHIDHFGGTPAVVSREDAQSGRVRVIAPQGFVHEATSENILAGVAMGRRSSFMYGFALDHGPRGHVDSGLGKAPSRGTFGLLPPSDVVDHTGQEMLIDGVRFVFQYTPESEAPAELTFYLPEWKIFCGAEVISHTMHNLYTLRGAKVRDALRWSGYIDEMIQLFGESETVFASHHWPIHGNERIIDYLKKQRDTYKFIHDQTLRLANAGYTPREIAEQLTLPPSLAESFPNRGYYGTLRHNSKAVYQGYFGWYDGNPANLDPLPPEPAAKKYVEAMGGRASVLAKAQDAYEKGDYRWASMLLDHLVFAAPDDEAARELLAASYDQLGYQAESAPWRDVYLTGAHELRHGTTANAIDIRAAENVLREMSVARFFDAMATRLNGPKAVDTSLTLNFIFTDLDESYVVTVENAVLSHRQAPPAENANATVSLTRDLWLRMATGQAGVGDLIFSDELELSGSRLDLAGFFRLLDQPGGGFNVVTP